MRGCLPGASRRKPTGKVTLIEFAASWCSPCRRTLLRLEAYAKERPDVRALVVSIDETAPAGGNTEDPEPASALDEILRNGAP